MLEFIRRMDDYLNEGARYKLSEEELIQLREDMIGLGESFLKVFPNYFRQ